MVIFYVDRGGIGEPSVSPTWGAEQRCEAVVQSIMLLASVYEIGTGLEQYV